MSKHYFSLNLKDGQTVTFNRPAIMGVVNTAPNSFYNPQVNIELALKTAGQMVAEGADILDIGGEATNPFVDIEQEQPSVQAEIKRVAPLVAMIKNRFDKILISIDTSRPEVMRAAVEAGADIINDQRALRLPGALAVALELNTPVCLMHMFENTRSDALEPNEFLQLVLDDINKSIQRCKNFGIGAEKIIIDPGFGQGNYQKSCAENFYLLANLSKFTDLGYPVLTGWSRKSMIGDALGGAPATERLYGTIAANTLASYFSASIIRVHDVKPALDAVKVVNEVKHSFHQELCDV